MICMSFLEKTIMTEGLLKEAYREFKANDPLRMAAATAFFASFALPPIMIILIEILGVFGDARAIRHGLLDQLSVAFDKNIALEIRQILRNIHHLPINPVTRIGGFVFLLFVATTLFEVIRSSMNQLWRIRLKERPSLGFLLLYRIRSIGVIMTAGLLFALVFLLDTTAWLLPALANKIFYHIITVAAGMIWFTLILRYQSYGRPAWRTALTGGFFTGLLFAIGEVLLHLVLSYNNMQTIYGASTSLALLLLFIFYSSFIFYFGVCFTGALAARTGPIQLTRHAMKYV
jgi:membrane protein